MKFSASLVQTNASMFITVGARGQAQVAVVGGGCTPATSGRNGGRGDGGAYQRVLNGCDGVFHMVLRQEIPSCFLIMCGGKRRGNWAGRAGRGSLGPLYLCAVTDSTAAVYTVSGGQCRGGARVSAGCYPRFPTVAGARLVPAVLQRCAYLGLQRTIERAGMAMLGSQGQQPRSLVRIATECVWCRVNRNTVRTHGELGQISAHAITRSPISRWRWVTRWPRNSMEGSGGNTLCARGPSTGGGRETARFSGEW
jgi:hypothetical protein